jgi:sarcosine oxidase, subunit beta
VVVIGAGVIGLSIAFHAAGRGLRTLVCERKGIAAEASGVQPGGVRQQWSTDVNCLLARESHAFYRAIHEHLEARVRPKLEACGYLFLAHSREAREQLAESVKLQNSHGIPSELLSVAEIAALVDGLDTARVVGGSYCAEDGYFDKPQGVVEAFAQAAVAQGAHIEISVVRGLRADGAGWELELDHGARAYSDQVVIAASYDTNAIVSSLGVELPLTKSPKYLLLSEPIHERLLEPLVISHELHFAAKHLADGRVLASDLTAEGDPAVDGAGWRGHVRSVIEQMLPILQYVSFPLVVEGFYDMTPDSQGVVSALDGFDGVWVAAGFNGHGFMIAPAVGRGMADLLQGKDPGMAIKHLDAARFGRAGLELETQVV